MPLMLRVDGEATRRVSFMCPSLPEFTPGRDEFSVVCGPVVEGVSPVEVEILLEDITPTIEGLFRRLREELG